MIFPPRFSVVYDLTADGTVLISGGFSRYYQLYSGALLAYADFAAPLSQLTGIGFSGDYNDLNHDSVITPDEISGSILINYKDELSRQLYDSHLSNPYVNEFMIGFQKSFSKDWIVSANLMHRTYHDSIVGVPFGLTPDHYQYIETVLIHTTVGDYDVPIYRLTDFTDNGTFILRTNKIFTQTYDSLDLFIRKNFSEKFFLSGGVVLQRQKAHHLSEEFPPWYDFALNFFYLNQQFNYSVRENKSYGYIGIAPSVSGAGSFPHPDWQLKIAGSYNLPLQMSLGAFLRYEQGVPLGPFGITNFHAFLFTGLFNVEPNATRRNDNIFTLDINVTKEFSISNFGKLDAVLEIINATNSNPVLQRENFLGVINNSVYEPYDNFNRILEYLPPRILRLGLRYSF